MAIDDLENGFEEGGEGSEEDLSQQTSGETISDQAEATDEQTAEQLAAEVRMDSDEALAEEDNAVAADDGSVSHAQDTNPTAVTPIPLSDETEVLADETLQMPTPEEASVSNEPPSPQVQESPAQSVSEMPKPNKASFLTKLLASKNGRIGIGAAAAALVLMVLFGTHIICFHSWQDPTCTLPSICSKCGRSNGEPLSHDWQDATCTEPKTCARCGETEGKALGHEVSEWKVTKEATCTAAGEESGECTRCGEVQKREVPMTAHSYGKWETVKAATCTEEGEEHRVCKVCGKEETRKLDKVEHTPGDWEVTVAAKPKAGGGSTKGEEARRCTVCGEVLETREYTLSAEELKAAFIEKCYSPTYEDVARKPDDWDGYEVKFTGEVIQVMQDGNDYTLRVNVTQGDYFWSDTIMVYYEAPSGAPRILEDDILTFYGIMHGMYSYTSVLGATITVPLMEALYVE